MSGILLGYKSPILAIHSDKEVHVLTASINSAYV